MSRLYRPAMALTLVGCWLVGGSALLFAEDKPAKKSEDKAEAKRRLPNNWSKLDLSDDQKEKAYNALEKGRKANGPLASEVKDLRARLKVKAAALKDADAALDKELIAILTPAQRQKLEDLKSQASAATKKPAPKKKAKSSKPKSGGD